MERYTLWYLKDGDEIKGPFPERVLVDLILLGRVGEKMLISHDHAHWISLSERPHLLLDFLNIDPDDPERDTKLAQARRRADQRTGMSAGLPDEEGDRRKHVDALPHADIRDLSERMTLRPLLILILIISLIALIAFLFQGELSIG